MSPQSKPLTIAVVGSLTRDIIFETERIPKLGESVLGTSLSFKHAGKGANIAVAAYRASHRKPENTHAAGGDGNARDDARKTDSEIGVFMNGAVGDDDVGPSLRHALGEQGIDVHGVAILPGAQTGQAAIILDTRARQASQLGFKGANALYRPRDGTAECLAGSTGVKPDVLITHCTMDLDMVARILRTAHDSGTVTVLSPSPPVSLDEEVYKSVIHVVFNEHEAAEIFGRPVEDLADVEVAMQTAQGFVERGPRFAVVTLGEAGAVYATHDGKRGHVPAERDVNVQDTTGAGDSFLGAYVVDYVRQKREGGFDIERAVAFACKAAARTVESLGAQISLPWADQIQ